MIGHAASTGVIAAANGGGVIPANANLYPATSADTVVVGSMADLETQVNAAPPGRHILIADGTYAGDTRIFDTNGTAADPIVIRPQNAGMVTITSPAWTMASTSSRLVIAGLTISGGRLTMNGANNRIDRNTFNNIQQDQIVTAAAIDCRVSRNSFGPEDGTTNDRSCVRIDPGGTDDGTNVRLRVDLNDFHDWAPVATTAEIVRMFAQKQNIALPLDTDVVTIDRNLFRNLGGTGEKEIVSWKSGGWTISGNTVENATGWVFQSRSGDNGLFIRNWLEGRGLHLWGRNHVVAGNQFVNATEFWVAAGDATQEEIIAGTASLASYGRAENCQIVGNRVDNFAIDVGGFWSQGGSNPVTSKPALNNNLFANTRDIGTPVFELDPTWSIGTTTNDPSIAYTPAVKLTTADVGPNAVDPYE